MANTDLRRAISELLAKEYNSGKNQMVSNFAVNITWLKKHYDADNEEKFDRELEKLKIKLEEQSQRL
jgi:hypothetical protein